MANQLFVSARQSFLTGGFDWTSANLKMAILDTTYVFDENQEFVDEVPGASIVQVEDLTNPTAIDGFANADSLQFDNVVAGNQIAYLIIYDDTGVPATSRLLAYFDTVTGLPTDASGQNFVIFPDALFGGYFRL